MKFERLEMSLIIPFRYNALCYEKIGTDEDNIGTEHFRRKLIRSDRLNEQNKNLWKDEDRGFIRCLELLQKSRKILGLHANENCIYLLKNKNGENIPFKITKVRGWFFKSGNGYLTLHVTANELDENQVLDLRFILSDVKAEGKIRYEVKKLDKVDDVTVSVKKFIRNFFGILGEIMKEGCKKPPLKAMTLVYGIVEELDTETSGIYFEKLRLNADVSSQVTHKIDSSFLYQLEKYPYINWIVSAESLCGIADMRQACEISEKNGDFLREGLGPAVFRDYLMVYLYYISLNSHVDELEKQSREAANDMCVYPSMRKIHYLQRQLVMLTNQMHINTLFYRYLCTTVWDIAGRLEQLTETSENDVFISYRRKYGGYPARLIFDKLKQSGCKVFYDYKSMRAGDFNVQLVKAMKRGMYVIAVLTPGCLEEDTVGGKENYMLKELRRAMEPENEIRVINVFVDDFSFPKQLPHGLEGIDTQHGIYMDAENLESALEKIAEVVRRG